MGQKNRVMNPFLSIIIPVYKSEEFIGTCLNSVFNQIPGRVEVILVNDGSPDNSMDIVKSLFAKWLDSGQLILLEQENMGPGAARNSGLSVARGEYVGFLDSDDILLENYFSILLDILSKYKTDIIEFGFNRFHEPSDIKKNRYQFLYTFKGSHKLEEVRNEIFSVGIWFPWTRVYKKEIFEKIRFPVGVFYEDLMTIPHVYLRDIEGYFIDQPLIGYRFNPDSTTALHAKSHVMDMCTFYTSLTKLDRTIPIEILKIKTARGIAYFFNELQSPDIPIVQILNDIDGISKRYDLLKNLKFPDLLFFVLPGLYMLIDKIRLYKLKGNSM